MGVEGTGQETLHQRFVAALNLHCREVLDKGCLGEVEMGWW